MNDEKEEWRPVVGWEGYYEVSSIGRVRSVQRIRGQGPGNSILKPRILKENKTKGGYVTVHLSKEGLNCTARVHRLVAMAFIPNTFGYPIINHKDENKTNNMADNLEWCTYEYNTNYGNAIARKVLSTIKPVIIYNIITGEYLKFASVKEAGIFLNVEPSNVSACCKRKKNATRNHICRYAEERITKEDIRKAIDRFKPVVQMDLCGKTIKTFSTMSEAARETKTQLSNLCLCCQGKQKYSNGFKWRYKNE